MAEEKVKLVVEVERWYVERAKELLPGRSLDDIVRMALSSLIWELSGWRGIDELNPKLAERLGRIYEALKQIKGGPTRHATADELTRAIMVGLGIKDPRSIKGRLDTLHKLGLIVPSEGGYELNVKGAP